MRQPLERPRSDDFQSEIFGELSCKFYAGGKYESITKWLFPDDPNNTSSQFEMQRYMNKLSGWLLDRIDIHIEVQKVEFEQLSDRRKAKAVLQFGSVF